MWGGKGREERGSKLLRGYKPHKKFGREKGNERRSKLLRRMNYLGVVRAKPYGMVRRGKEGK